MMLWLVLPIAAFAAAVCGHAVVSRLLPNGSRVLTFVAVGGAVGLVLLYGVIAQYGLWDPRMLAATAIYAGACELYIFLFTLAMASISANVLVRLRKEQLSADDLSRSYDGRTMATRRVDRLVETNLAAVAGDGLALTERGQRLAQAFIAMRGFFHSASPSSS